jgi:hypothetical protein
MNAHNGYLGRLLEGDAPAICALFAGEPLIDDPRAGCVEGTRAVEAFVTETAAWLAEHHARIEPVAVTKDHRREVSESVLHLELAGGPWGLPVAVVVEGDGKGASQIRVYHSMWPLIGAHRIRGPLLPPNSTMVLGGAVADYMRALALGNLEGILGAYEPDAMFREPSGGEYAFSGAEKLREIYSLVFGNGGGVQLQHCTATDDSVTCAVEYNAMRWGDTLLSPQAGIAVYVRGASGRLAAARIYDDVQPPAVSDSTQYQS